MSRPRLLTLSLAALVVAGAGAAQAAELVVDCQVHANQPDHGRTDWRRRLIINHETRTVRILDDFGQGLQPRDEYPIHGSDARQITLEVRPGKTAYIDLRTHTYHLKDDPRRFTLEGPCRRATDIR